MSRLKDHDSMGVVGFGSRGATIGVGSGLVIIHDAREGRACLRPEEAELWARILELEAPALSAALRTAIPRTGRKLNKRHALELRMGAVVVTNVGSEGAALLQAPDAVFWADLLELDAPALSKELREAAKKSRHLYGGARTDSPMSGA